MSTRQLCTFHVEDLLLGVNVLEVQEVIRHHPMTRVPQSPRVVRGLINLRGQIVTAIDLRLRLGLKPLTAEDRPMNVVVRTATGAVSLLVDEIGDVLEVDETSLSAPPKTLRGPARELVTSICKLQDRLLLVLNVDRAVDVGAPTASAN
jgi:purine-binding chemotaxis protein CheW